MSAAIQTWGELADARKRGTSPWSCSSLEKLSDLVMVSCENEHVAWMHLAAASSADSHGFSPYGNGPMIATWSVESERRESGLPKAPLDRRIGRIVFAT